MHFYISDLTLPLSYQVEYQAVVRAALQLVGATLPLMAGEQQTFGKESREEQEDLSKYNKMPFEILE